MLLRPSLRPVALLAAIGLSLPALMGALEGGADPTAAAVRFLLAYLACLVFGGLVEKLVIGYADGNEAARIMEEAAKEPTVVERRRETDRIDVTDQATAPLEVDEPAA